jgi:PPOX class probable F420-dependent enzyme
MGVNQRQQIKMTDTEVDEFLRGRRTMSMASIGPDGSIHVVAMWYGFLEGSIAVETKAKSQKVQNLRRDPRLTVLVESGERYEELKGVELVGRAEVIDDPERLWQIGVSVFERYNAPYNDDMRPFVEAMLHKRLGIKLDVDRVVSWDHAKLGT